METNLWKAVRVRNAVIYARRGRACALDARTTIIVVVGSVMIHLAPGQSTEPAAEAAGGRVGCFDAFPA